MALILGDVIDLNAGNFVVTGIFSFICWLLSRSIKDRDEKIKQMEIHLENTDKEVQSIKDNHNSLNLTVVEKLNELKLDILGKIGELNIKMEQWKNNGNNNH